MELNVKGMHCKACVMLISEALEEQGAQNVSVTLDERKKMGKVSLDTTMSKQEVKKIIESQGDYSAL